MAKGLVLELRPQALPEMLDIADGHLEKMTGDIARAAQNAAPEGVTGDLKESHGVKKMKRGIWIVTVDKFYAAWVHWGRKKYGDKGQPWVLKAAKMVGLTTKRRG